MSKVTSVNSSQVVKSHTSNSGTSLGNKEFGTMKITLKMREKYIKS